ncbi:MAG: hypothetical protein HUU55_10130 [Myxococcales bacterium]|nr:hypothetical protein [Myxococcales bacterium]
MDPKQLEELRKKLREGQIFDVREGHVYLQSAPASVKPEKNTPEPQGVEVKNHRWAMAFEWNADLEKRIFTEKAVLSREYPLFGIDLHDDGTPYVHGFIGPTATLKQRYHVMVTLPPAYGTGVMPRAYVISPDLIPNAPHQYIDGHLCLDEGGAFTARSTLVTFLAWVSVWLVLYEAWVETGIPW